MADYTQPPVVEKRVRFFDGQFLIDQDFIDEQKYHLDRERRQNRLLRVTGVAHGLNVSANGANQVKVTQGIAVDSLGRQLVLAEDRIVDLLPAEKFNDQQLVRLYILYQETPVDMAETGSESHRRWLETPQIVAATEGGVSTEPWDNQTIPVLLARLNLDNNGIVAVDNSGTQYAGMSLTGSIGIGTSEPGSYKLNVQGGDTNLGGSLTVQGTTKLGGNLNVQGTTDLAGNTFAHGSLQVDGTSAFAGNVGIGTADLGSYKLNVQGGHTNLGGNLNVRGIVDVQGGGLRVTDGDIRWGNQSQLKPDQGGSIELGGDNDTAGSGTPYIDFHFSGQKQDYNTRIINDADGRLSLQASTVQITGNVGIGTNAPGAKLDVRADATTAGGWYEAIHFSQAAHSAITHPGGGLLFGLHSDRSFYFADIAGGTLQKYVLKIEAGTGNIGIGTDSPGAKLHVTGPVMERLEVINCWSDAAGNWHGDNWDHPQHPIMIWFGNKLRGQPVGTYVKAIQNRPGWRGHYWQGWVDFDGGIRVIHNANNTGAVVPALRAVPR